MGCSSMVEQAAVNGKVAGSSPAVPVSLLSAQLLLKQNLKYDKGLRVQKIVIRCIQLPNLLSIKL